MPTLYQFKPMKQLTFHAFSLSYCHILYTTLQKLSSNAVRVRKAIQHFEVAINDIRENLPQVNGNPEPSKRL
jgi:hypothetical protein